VYRWSMHGPRWVLALVLAAVPGCLVADEVVCGDGTVCPADHRCVDAACVPETKFEACEGLEPGDACTLAGIGGRCRNGQCVDAYCGDTVTDPGEVCDDGNTETGDGCTPDCLSNETCGNGVIDFSGPDGREECDCGGDLATLSPLCTEPNSADGMSPTATCRSTCVTVRCGNGLVDLGEVCDDGNLEVDDGCTPDCLSDETCGNGILDFFAGEHCDDGNLDERDGCASTCEPETLTWTRTPEVPGPPGRLSQCMAYDPLRRLTVMFGGTNAAFGEPTGGPMDDTWVWDGTSWRELAPPTRPSARFGCAMTYDSKRARIVMYGGTAGQVFHDTWSFDGATWTDLEPPEDAGELRFAGMAYDAARDRVVIFGGANAANTGRDGTWEFDGTTWTRVTTATVPTGRWASPLAYDPVRGRIVLFGGAVPVFGSYVPDTWEYDGTDWTQVMTPTTPPGRASHTLTWMPTLGAVVMTSGTGGVQESWRYDGLDWTLLAVGPTPSARQLPTAAFDVARQELMLFGGLGPGYQADTWRFDGSAWTEVTVAPAPPARRGHTVAYDSQRGRVVVFGGYTGAYAGDTWAWDGGRWTEVVGAGPPARHEAAMAEDPLRGALVLFGGYNGTSSLGDTWELRGDTWTEATPLASPPSRFWHAMTYDPDRAAVVTLGGRTDDPFASGGLDDTWAFDGVTWQVVTPTSPGLRSMHGLAFDYVTRRLVTFGGATNGLDGAATDETWALEPDGWTLVPTDEAPGPRLQAGLVSDPLRRRITLFGGEVYCCIGYGATGGTWEFDGASWRELDPEVAPPLTSHTRPVYDAVRGQVTMFAGVRSAVVNAETWTYGYVGQVATEACEAGVTIDSDGDGLAACDDPDCWPICAPTCPPPEADDDICAPDADGPRCGDPSCQDVESCRTCPLDCGACAAQCGDTYCDPPEDAASCPGDCPP
jgi:cysteine-rich repeat protein